MPIVTFGDRRRQERRQVHRGAGAERGPIGGQATRFAAADADPADPRGYLGFFGRRTGSIISLTRRLMVAHDPAPGLSGSKGELQPTKWRTPADRIDATLT